MSLNTEQQKAVEHKDGPLLILAGAGSGKTTVLMNRIARLIEQGVDPYQILAVTFTNKAANEMKERIETMIGEKAHQVFMSTFHSMCVRILRYEIASVPQLDANFTIYDSNQSKSLIKRIMDELGVLVKKGEEDDEGKAKPEKIQSYISDLKNEMVDFPSFRDRTPSNSMIDWSKATKLIAGMEDERQILLDVYPRYQEELRKCNAADFDDLILFTIRLFEQQPYILEKYQRRFQYIMVDEYQDTNHAQYTLITKLAEKHRNLAVVGDDFQSIYAFRGSDIRNILRFDEEYPDATVIKLEQNYRSTKTIIQAANEVIANNQNQKKKTLFTENAQGDKIKVYESPFSDSEAYFVMNEIQRLQRKGVSLDEIAVLYRSNAQSGLIETALNRYDIPNSVSGSIGFWRRMEIVDIISFLNLLVNPNSLADFFRIANKPKRGLGEASVKKLIGAYPGDGGEFFDHAKTFKLPKKAREGMDAFLSIMNDLQIAKSTMTPSALIMETIRKTEYKQFYAKEDVTKRRDRTDNLNMLVQLAMDFEEEHKGCTLDQFMEELVLRNTTDLGDSNEEKVSLMTIHAAKGLEYKIVFFVGMNEGKFPAPYAQSEEDIEEERRCCYVALTRAKEQLYLTYSDKERNPFKRDAFGDPKISSLEPSRFLQEIDSALCEYVPSSSFDY